MPAAHPPQLQKQRLNPPKNIRSDLKTPTKYLAIDEEGYPLFGELRVTDIEIGHEILANIFLDENGAFVTTLAGEDYYVEAFDEPFVAKSIIKPEKEGSLWRVQMPYEVEAAFDPHTLTLDEWDRFHGVAQAKQPVPFVMSRAAQALFFQSLDGFDDDSITIQDETISVKPWLAPEAGVSSPLHWSQIYLTETPRWELNQPAPALLEMLPKLRLPKSRIAVLGCGSGNDAALFAQQGHKVTAIDFTEEALKQAKAKYPNLDINWVQADVFKLGEEYTHQFDIVFEHTCYCAVDPFRRNELVKVWHRLLTEQGFLLAVLFTMERKSAAPFGGSEWEIRERLKKNFRFLFWGRWRGSIERRQGKELFVYAQLR